MYQSPTQVLPPPLTMTSGEVNLSPQYTRQKQAIDIPKCIAQVEQGIITPKTTLPPQSGALLLGTLDDIKMGRSSISY